MATYKRATYTLEYSGVCVCVSHYSQENAWFTVTVTITSILRGERRTIAIVHVLASQITCYQQLRRADQ